MAQTSLRVCWFGSIAIKYPSEGEAMVSQIQPPTQPEVIYLDSDVQLVANNTIQFSWIVEIKQNIEWLFADLTGDFKI
ncbi:hypothetical protein A6V25_05430 [Nostoc sp. ATCC 53789]|nr:hypothetical protein GJB62_09730 [Nostoc sp. ATCC 53789]RCJ20797.1 hypothetical protein A6V25_05430 [Nostoc sp. ATCC 53789]